jgi:AcrR family transcriptional regulator
MTDPSATTHAHDPEKRRRLIAAAAAAFARIGFAETNVDGIARDAGVAKGTVYLYFQNKRALFLAVLSELQRRLADGVALKERAASDERLRAFVRRQLLLADEEPELFRCYTSALFGVNRDFQDAALQVFTWQVERLRVLLRDQAGASTTRRQAQILAANILSTALVRGITDRAGGDTRIEEELLLGSAAAMRRR